MRHLIVSREYPPSPYPAGGIGTYVRHIARLLAGAGDEVHVIAQRWAGAPDAAASECGGRLVIHRVALDGPLDDLPAPARGDHAATLAALAAGLPALRFAWQAATLAESLVERAGIDVIEGQEWEAPLWLLQLRRSLGLGPARRPPCLVHLHSPTELIFRHNDWEPSRREFLPLKQMEDATIAAADALLCPSAFLAREAESHYALPVGAVHVVPLPLGDTPRLARTAEAWRAGTVCYVGRLEPRKGVVEWVDAAVAVARERADVRFTLVGADLPYAAGVSVGELVTRRIPPALRARFSLTGAVDRDALQAHLAAARIAVVPSRWENFPYACVEAMASGLPVLASPNGGTREMVSDGRTGWLAASSSPHALADALRRALDTPAATLASMGDAAAAAVRACCDNDVILARHRALRRELAARAAVPAPVVRGAADAAAPRGIAVVVGDFGDGERRRATLASVAAQTQPPAARVLVAAAGTAAADARLALAHEMGDTSTWHVLDGDGASDAGAAAGWRAVAALEPPPLGVVFLQAGETLAPAHLERMECALRAAPRVAVLAPWERHDARASRDAPGAAPVLALPYLLLDDALGAGAVFRLDALREAGGVRDDLPAALALLDAAAAVLAAGWRGAPYPSALAARPPLPAVERARVAAARPRARRLLLARAGDAATAHAVELVVLADAWRREEQARRLDAEGATRAAAAHAGAAAWATGPGEELRGALRTLRRLASAAAARPWAAVRWLGRATVRAVRRRVATTHAGRAPTGVA